MPGHAGSESDDRGDPDCGFLGQLARGMRNTKQAINADAAQMLT